SKLFSIIPHTAGCKCVWSRLGWLYRKRRNKLALQKIENMHKVSSYYYSHTKNELPYYSIKKLDNEIYKILVDEYLNFDEDFIEIIEEDLDKNYNETYNKNNIFEEKNNLLINNIVNLNQFYNFKEIEDIMNEEYNNENINETETINSQNYKDYD
ncbi:4372_t:CDS:1, partial [Cetraspora pellucida]